MPLICFIVRVSTCKRPLVSRIGIHLTLGTLGNPVPAPARVNGFHHETRSPCTMLPRSRASSATAVTPLIIGKPSSGMPTTSQFFCKTAAETQLLDKSQPLHPIGLVLFSPLSPTKGSGLLKFCGRAPFSSRPSLFFHDYHHCRGRERRKSSRCIASPFREGVKLSTFWIGCTGMCGNRYREGVSVLMNISVFCNRWHTDDAPHSAAVVAGLVQTGLSADVPFTAQVIAMCAK